jgi:branched-chain amino acid aminotransferase
MRTVFIHDKFLPEADAKISIYDLSVMQGAAVFEMTRSFNGRHFKLREHLERLEQSCRLLSIPMPMPIPEIERIIEKITARNDHGPGEEHRLLIVVSPGCASIYRDLEGVITEPYLYVADFPLRYTVQGMGKYFTEGVYAIQSDIKQPSDDMLPMSAKHRSRLHFHLAQLQAPSNTWPLLRSVCGTVAEVPGANVVAYFGSTWMRWRGAMRSPLVPCQTNCLPGISMQTVVELLADEFPVGAKTVHFSRLYDADEIWLTGTPFCMLPVVSLDGYPIGDGKPGKYFQRTIERWSNMVGVDIVKQIQEWDARYTA